MGHIQSTQKGNGGESTMKTYKCKIGNEVFQVKEGGEYAEFALLF